MVNSAVCKEMHHIIWDSLPPGLIDKAINKFSKWLKASVEDWGLRQTLWTFLVNAQCRILHCRLHDIIYCVSAQMFLNTIKSLGGSAAALIILRWV